MNTKEQAIIEDGGPAFHSITVKDGDNYNPPTKYYHRGMSLRDWFAGQALAGILAHHQSTELGQDGIIDSAYELADAMLERRKK